MILLKKLLVLLLLALIISALWSKYALSVTEYTLPGEGLPNGLNGLRIVQLSDLHGSNFGRDNSRLVRRVAEAKPDIILLTGDMADNEKEMRAFSALVKGISGIAPCYYVNGNHEYAGHCTERISKLLEQEGINVLVNEYKTLEINGKRLVIAGADDPNGRADMIKPDELAQRVREDYPEDFVIWLGHRNYWVEKYPKLPVDVIFSGHAHGGIIRLPIIGGLINVNHYFGAEYEAGVYEGENFRMVVSRGLGNSVPIPRLFNTPEIVCVTLEKSE